MNPTIDSPVFGPGVIRNASLPGHRHIEFNNHMRPRLYVFHDGSFSLSGLGGSCAYSGHLDTIDDVVAEVKRLVGEVKQ